MVYAKNHPNGYNYNTYKICWIMVDKHFLKPKININVRPFLRLVLYNNKLYEIILDISRLNFFFGYPISFFIMQPSQIKLREKNPR